MPIVYCIRHIASGREYVGYTARSWRQRWKEHRTDANGRPETYFHRALKKYGPEAFACELLADLPEPAEAKIAERIAIALRQPEFNLTRGGDGCLGRVWSEAEKAQLSAVKKGVKKSQEARARMSAAKTGKPLSAAHRSALSASGKRAWAEGKMKHRKPRRRAAKPVVYTPRNRVDWST